MEYLGILEKVGSDTDVATALGTTRQTVHAWRTGRRSPKAIEVYRMCCKLHIRPETFAQTERMIVLNLIQGAGDLAPEGICHWVRRRMSESRMHCEDDFVDDITSIARRADMDRRTALRVLSDDGVRWDFLMRFIMDGLGVHPFALISPGPVPHARRRFSRGPRSMEL